MWVLQKRRVQSLLWSLSVLVVLGACSSGGTLQERMERATTKTEQALQGVGEAVQGTLERPVKAVEQKAGDTTRKVGAGSTRLGEAIEEKTGVKGNPQSPMETSE